MSNNASLLFACSACFARHPFEELSSGEQLCKECRGAFPVVKCTYCRSEFQQTSKSSTSAICKKCETNVKSYGKPTACEYCNIIAAFIGNKCQRCTNSERKYGPAVTCEQCKQRCAFDRHDSDKSDGKLLCWLCTLSWKRAVARTKQVESERRGHLKPRTNNKMKNHKRSSRGDLSKGLNSSDLNSSDIQPSEKKSKSAPTQGEIDPNSSDHVVAMTQLKETIASMTKKLAQKDSLILSKDKLITELKAQHFTTESELRNQMKDVEKRHDNKCDLMNVRIQNLLKEVATLSRTANKVKRKGPADTGNSGSGTDSPSTT